MAGETAAPPEWGSPFADILTTDLLLSDASWVERLAFWLLNRLPPGYRLQPNRTLAAMAAIRCGTATLAVARTASLGAGRGSGAWEQTIAPVLHLLGPNGLGEIYIMTEAGRQVFIDGGVRLAETAARGTRLMLALQLYEAERGDLPARLDDLAPRWIEAVPADPYDGRPFRYDRGRRLVYAVGPNGRDDGGRREEARGNCGDDVLFSIPR